MSAPSPDIGELDCAAVPPDESEAPDAGTGDAVESVTAEPEPVEGQAVPDTELDLAAVVAERDAYLGDLQRVTAEFTNFRRQTMKRNTELVAQAASRLARELLVVLDACEAAVGQGVEGIEALQSQLLGVLSAEGLAVLGTVDEPFDPGFHEAVMSEESDDDGQDAPIVAEVLRTGYAWNGRVLRPAMVKVRG
ncbi:MAG: nucleotide exchange factor GrpE [Acidimicrobiia bacterium]|nr:nucleotide exchange factor GrpE [Acidimicrobiia bacterium]